MKPVRLVVLSSLLLATACSAVLGMDDLALDPGYGSGDAGLDAHDDRPTVGDVAAQDAGADAAPIDGAGADTGSDAGSDADAAPDAAEAGVVWSDLSQLSKWDKFDLAVPNGASLKLRGAAFDGQYLHFAPSSAGSNQTTVLRCDTHAAFNASGSWTQFDASALGASLKGFSGAVFDGRYVYFVPSGGSSSPDGP